MSHVVHLPYSAHPSSVYQVYDFDADHIKTFATATKTEGGTQEYLEKYVYGVKDHWGYLEQVGGLQRLNDLSADHVLGY